MNENEILYHFAWVGNKIVATECAVRKVMEKNILLEKGYNTGCISISLLDCLLQRGDMYSWSPDKTNFAKALIECEEQRINALKNDIKRTEEKINTLKSYITE